MSTIAEQAKALRIGGPRNTQPVHIASGTCWNAEQLAEVIEKYDRYGELIKMEITHGFSPGKTQYQWVLLMYAPLNEDGSCEHCGRSDGHPAHCPGQTT